MFQTQNPEEREFGKDLTNKNPTQALKNNQNKCVPASHTISNKYDNFEYTSNGECIAYINEIYEFLRLREVNIIFPNQENPK